MEMLPPICPVFLISDIPQESVMSKARAIAWIKRGEGDFIARTVQAYMNTRVLHILASQLSARQQLHCGWKTMPTKIRQQRPPQVSRDFFFAILRLVPLEPIRNVFFFFFFLSVSLCELRRSVRCISRPTANERKTFGEVKNQTQCHEVH
jgi:hypothetical protein